MEIRKTRDLISQRQETRQAYFQKIRTPEMTPAQKAQTEAKGQAQSTKDTVEINGKPQQKSYPKDRIGFAQSERDARIAQENVRVQKKETMLAEHYQSSKVNLLNQLQTGITA